MRSHFSDIIQKETNGLLVRVRARPGVKKVRMPSIVDCGDGKYALQLSVAAQAVEGKANKALMAAFAKWLGVKKAAVTLKAGQTAPLKTLYIEGDTEELIRLLEKALYSHSS